MSIPRTLYAAGISGAAAFAAGCWITHAIMAGQQAQREAAAATEAREYMERAAGAKAQADAIMAAITAKTARALREAQNARREPIQCPPSGDVRDAPIPGLADRLRAIRAAGGDGAAPGVAPLQP